MTKFLEQVADYIIEQVGNDTLQTVVILPNKRSEIFLKNHLQNRIKANYWLPDIYTIDDFIVDSSGIVELDPINLYFELYKIHKNLEGSDARSLDDFFTWAPIMLADFTDIDLYLADAEEVFTNLSEIKAIQQWNPSGEQLTDLQKNYLSFYRSLYSYYSELRNNLITKGLGYKGMIYRHVFEQILTISNNWTWKRFVLVGFNALSESEKRIFKYLKAHFKVDILLDIDSYYFSEDNPGKHEAGRFIKDLIEYWQIKNVKWKSNFLSNGKKEINILGIPKQIGQVKYAAQMISGWIRDQKIEQTEVLIDTAVVLGDEKLLVPVLNSLPQHVDGKNIPVNLTMGYPLKNSPVAQFVLIWIELLDSANSNKYNKFALRHVQSLLYNPFVRVVTDFYCKNSSQSVLTTINKKNSLFLAKEDIITICREECPDLEPLFNTVLQSHIKPEMIMDLLIDLLIEIKPVFYERNGSLGLLKEQIVIIVSLAKRLKILLKSVGSDLNLKALEKIFIQLLNRSEINLKGEPLNGIQVMGMLESRNLDFKNLIILSLNDGILPGKENIDTLIPFDIRRQYKLPLPGDKSDVYAYHFYRLLQRAENVTLLYNTESDAFGGGEKSRFIVQIEDELSKLNQNARINTAQIEIPMGNIAKKQSISVVKSDQILQLVKSELNKSLFPTALSAYINCPLKYYFRYIIDLKPYRTTESSIEADVFGNAVHEVLEDLYKPFEGQQIDIEKLKLNEPELKRLVADKFRKVFPGGDLQSGQNLLTVEVANQYIRRFLASEAKNLSGQYRVLIATEERLKVEMNVSGCNINLTGIVDRADKAIDSDVIRILDYKTGDVVPRNLHVKEWESLVTDPDMDKAFQVLFYSFMYIKNKMTLNDIEAGVISLKNISYGFIPLKLPDNTTVHRSVEKFETLIRSLINRIIDPGIPFNQTTDEERCKYCDYQDICNR